MNLSNRSLLTLSRSPSSYHHHGTGTGATGRGHDPGSVYGAQRATNSDAPARTSAARPHLSEVGGFVSGSDDDQPQLAIGCFRGGEAIARA
jgi:hypothetical protein